MSSMSCTEASRPYSKVRPNGWRHPDGSRPTRPEQGWACLRYNRAILRDSIYVGYECRELRLE